jgi:hypothetical protein
MRLVFGQTWRKPGTQSYGSKDEIILMLISSMIAKPH